MLSLLFGCTNHLSNEAEWEHVHDMNDSQAARGPFGVLRFLSAAERTRQSVGEASEPIWIKAPTRKWEVQGKREVGVMSLLSS